MGVEKFVKISGTINLPDDLQGRKERKRDRTNQFPVKTGITAYKNKEKNNKPRGH